MSESAPTRRDLFHGLFVFDSTPGHAPQLLRDADAPLSIPDPESGRLLKIATVEGKARAICPSCANPGIGGYVSFVQDLRLAYACPSCQKLVWLPGA